MADSELSALTAATTLDDADELYANDSGTSKRITVANARGVLGGPANSGLGSTRLTGVNWGYILPPGPYQSLGTNTTGIAGTYVLALYYLPGGTITEAQVRLITAGASGDVIHWVAYNADTDLLPATLAHSISFDGYNAGSGGRITVSSLSITITAGWYYVGHFVPTGNTGTPAFEGAVVASTYVNSESEINKVAIYTVRTDTTPQDLSAVNATGSSASGFNNNAYSTMLITVSGGS